VDKINIVQGRTVQTICKGRWLNFDFNIAEKKQQHVFDWSKSYTFVGQSCQIKQHKSNKYWPSVKRKAIQCERRYGIYNETIDTFARSKSQDYI